MEANQSRIHHINLQLQKPETEFGQVRPSNLIILSSWLTIKNMFFCCYCSISKGLYNDPESKKVTSAVKPSPLWAEGSKMCWSKPNHSPLCFAILNATSWNAAALQTNHFFVELKIFLPHPSKQTPRFHWLPPSDVHLFQGYRRDLDRGGKLKKRPANLSGLKHANWFNMSHGYIYLHE